LLLEVGFDAAITPKLLSLESFVNQLLA